VVSHDWYNEKVITKAPCAFENAESITVHKLKDLWLLKELAKVIVLVVSLSLTVISFKQ
jgi:hypothetical protein